VLNTPTKQVVCDNGFGRGIQLIGNKDMKVFVVILIPLSKNDYQLHGYLTIFQLSYKRIGSMRNFRAIRGFVFDIPDLIPVMFFDEGNELIWFDATVGFLYRMVHEDISIRFYFRKEEFAFCVNMFNEACGGIPRVEGGSKEFNTF